MLVLTFTNPLTQGTNKRIQSSEVSVKNMTVVRISCHLLQSQNVITTAHPNTNYGNVHITKPPRRYTDIVLRLSIGNNNHDVGQIVALSQVCKDLITNHIQTYTIRGNALNVATTKTR